MITGESHWSISRPSFSSPLKPREVAVLALIFGTGLILFLMVVLRVWFAWMIYDPDYKPRPFSSAEWKQDRQNVSGTYSARALMYRDLLDRHDFDGWTRSEVEALLGIPDQMGNDQLRDAIYMIGFINEFVAIDPYYILIQYDESGTVRRWRFVQG